MASSNTDILLVILLICMRVQQEIALAQPTTLDASNLNVSSTSSTAVEPEAKTAATILGCPQLCECKDSEKRDGIIVDCMDRKITSVPDSLPDGAIYVNLKKNLISTLTNVSFAKWNTKSIQKINLSQNNISHIDKNALKYFNHLWVIDISYNNLTHINKTKFPVTHELNLEGNPLKLKPIAGFEESVFSSTQTENCHAIYRRVKTFQIDDQWKYLEHVSHIMANIDCAPGPFLKRISATITNHTITPQNNLTTTVQDNNTITLQNNDTVTPQNSTDDFSTNSSRAEENVHIYTKPVPTIYEAFFYGSLVVIFFTLILFRISQKYNHAWYRTMCKRFGRTSTRRPTVRGHIIHVNPLQPLNPLQRKQSHKPN